MWRYCHGGGAATVASCWLPVAAPTATPCRALIKKPGRSECAEWELCCAAKAIAVVNKHFSAWQLACTPPGQASLGQSLGIGYQADSWCRTAALSCHLTICNSIYIADSRLCSCALFNHWNRPGINNISATYLHNLFACFDRRASEAANGNGSGSQIRSVLQGKRRVICRLASGIRNWNYETKTDSGIRRILLDTKVFNVDVL